MPNLYELTGEIREIEKKVLSGELSPTDIFDSLQGIEAIFEEKAIRVGKFIKNIEPTILAVDEEIKRLQARKKSLTATIDNSEEYLRTNMQAANKKEIPWELWSIKLHEERDKVDIIDEDKLPDRFVDVDTKIKPNKKLIKEAIDAEEKVPGARLVKGIAPLVIK